MPLICEGVQTREGLSQSWHELACALFHFLSFVCSVSADELGVSSFLPSFLRPLPVSLSLSLLSFFLCLSLSASRSIIPPSFLSRCDSIAIPVMSAHYLWSVLRSSPHIGSGCQPMTCKGMCVCVCASTSYLIYRWLDLHIFLGCPQFRRRAEENSRERWMCIILFTEWLTNKGCVQCKQADMCHFQRRAVWKGGSLV